MGPPAHWPGGRPASGTSSRIKTFLIREETPGNFFGTSRPMGGREVPGPTFPARSKGGMYPFS
jgi:hypothetical protein